MVLHWRCLTVTVWCVCADMAQAWRHSSAIRMEFTCPPQVEMSIDSEGDAHTEAEVLQPADVCRDDLKLVRKLLLEKRQAFRRMQQQQQQEEDQKVQAALDREADLRLTTTQNPLKVAPPGHLALCV